MAFAQNDKLDLRDDGTALASWTDADGNQRNATIRRPLVREWRDLQKRAEDADAVISAAQAAAQVPDRATESGTTVEQLLWDEMVYGHVFVAILEQLAGQSDLDPSDMPLWTCEPMTIKKIVAHWRSVPLHRGGAPVAP